MELRLKFWKKNIVTFGELFLIPSDTDRPKSTIVRFLLMVLIRGTSARWIEF